MSKEDREESLKELERLREENPKLKFLIIQLKEEIEIITKRLKEESKTPTINSFVIKKTKRVPESIL